VTGGLRQTLIKRRLPKAAAETIASTITYFSNNRHRMRYDECLREGYAPTFVDFDSDGWLDIYASTGFMSFDRQKPDG
jgi:hypothetical protein